MQINTNLYSLNAQRHYAQSVADLDTRLQRLSSGLRINGARDDAAGLAIAERLTAGINGLDRAAKNASDAIALLQTADGGVAQVVENFQRIRELAVQSANGSNSSTDRDALQNEANALVAANSDFVARTRFNGIALLDGSFASQFQVGANAGETINIIIDPVLAPRTTTDVLTAVALRQTNAVGQVSGALAAGDLIINGGAIGASVAGAQAGQSSASAFAAAAAINAAGVVGVSATAANVITANTTAPANIPNGGLLVNGIALGPIVGANPTAVAASAAAAFTAAAGASGVTASASGGQLTLSTADGRDINLSETLAGYAASLGLATGPNHGTITVSDTPAPQTTLSIGGNNPGLVGLSAGNQVSAFTGGTVTILLPQGSGGEPLIDLSSIAGATSALDYLDGKIDSSNAVRSQLGAASNRLAASYTGILDGAANLAAARGRIRDTDYAAETAALTRGQVLRDAGVAIIAQANALPNQVLQLLR
ncbi:MAG: flagellin [Pseudomonadota bacterium]